MRPNQGHLMGEINFLCQWESVAKNFSARVGLCVSFPLSLLEPHLACTSVGLVVLTLGENTKLHSSENLGSDILILGGNGSGKRTQGDNKT